MIIIFFAIFHCLYGTYLKNTRVSHFKIWFIITIIDLLFYILTNICDRFLMVFALIQLISLVVSMYIIKRGNDYKGEDVDIYMVLGHQLENEQISICLKNRLDKLLDIASNNNKPIVLSGGKNKSSLSEASLMKEYLLLKGIDEKRILIEDKSTTTIENFKYSLNVLPKLKDSKILIISSEYHLYRAKQIANHLGITNIKGIAAKSENELLLHRILLEIYLLIFKK